jgi:DNA invertase Pin-like site-specific DNA recombinase
METERLSERILSGLANARRKGIRLGRPPGSTKDRQQLIDAYPGVVKDLKAGLSIRQTAAFRELSKDTIQRIKKAMKEPQLA